jgi:hypothetical protein
LLSATFLIADISGYTGYLAGVELDHAQDILADLIGSVVSALRPAFRLAKLEGDAAFMYVAGDAIDGSLLLDAVERCYLGFRRRRRDVRQATTCECDACARIPDLDLKFVVHHGVAIEQTVAGRKELLGADVIVVHRLLKNEVREQHGMGPYALFTDAVVAAAGLEPPSLGMVAHAETYEYVGEVHGWVLDLERRWAEEEERKRVFVRPDEAILDLTVDVGVPPQLAWEFLTTPGQRMTWQPWVTEVVVEGAAAGRRGPGSSNHCRHGKDAVIEEILDWRPYDYLTDRTVIETPDKPLKFTHTIEFEPTTAGTRIHMRFSPPPARSQRELAENVAGAYGAALRSVLPTLVEQLEARNPLDEPSAGSN